MWGKGGEGKGAKGMFTGRIPWPACQPIWLDFLQPRTGNLNFVNWSISRELCFLLVFQVGFFHSLSTSEVLCEMLPPCLAELRGKKAFALSEAWRTRERRLTMKSGPPPKVQERNERSLRWSSDSEEEGRPTSVLVKWGSRA